MGTTGIEIERGLRKLKIPFSVRTKDNLGGYKEGSVAVVNLQNSNQGNGSHWVSYYIPSKGEYNYYFDSYGLPPPESVVKLLKTKNRKIIYSDQQLQNLHSDVCGEYTIAFLRAMLKGRSLSTDAANKTKYLSFIYDLFDSSNTKENDAKVRDMINIRS